MNPLRKNLLYLHGHIAHAELAWKPDTRSAPHPRKIAAIIDKPVSVVRLLCPSARPRLVAPR